MIAKNKLRTKIKKLYTQIPIKKDLEYQDLFNQLNKLYPINFKKYNFINKIHAQYPLASKEEIALIVKTIFEVIREQVIEGYSVNVKFIFNEFRLDAINNGKYSFLKLKNRTFPSIRKKDYE